MTTDTMRERFEKFYSDQKQIPLSWISSVRCGEDYSDPYGNNPLQAAWVYYKQGQRDLIEAMGEPVAYHILSVAHGVNQVVSDSRIVKSWDGVSDFTRPLYRLPEDTPK